MQILVVDDEKLLVKGIKFNLENEGYEIDACYDGRSAVEMARQKNYSLILLDLMMPELDGMEACMEIRQFSTVPIIMLTAKSDDADKLLGFACGADDYITKPFNILELKARVQALLRRSNISSTTGPRSNRLIRGHITLDGDRRLVLVDETPIALTVKEYDLLELLMRSPGKVFSREVLLDTVWGYDFQGDIRTVDVHIRRLREKLEYDSANPTCIMTRWGVGYYFAE